MESVALLIAASLNAGTVLAIAALGLLINEKVGVVNLGAEGLMLCGALAGFAAVVHFGAHPLGFLAGMGVAALLSLVFGWLVIYLNTNQYATGLQLSLFGAGLSAFGGSPTPIQAAGAGRAPCTPAGGSALFWAPRCFASMRWCTRRSRWR